MGHIIFLFLFTLMGSVSTASATAKSFQNLLEGKWQGFCSPQALTNTGRICAYTFQKSGSGTYQCDYYKDVRCTSKDSKSITSPFQFTVSGAGEKAGKVSLIFLDREDVKQEKSRFYITGDVLRVQVSEVFSAPEAKKEDLEAQGVIPFFEYTKVKTSGSKS
ncbi:MAG TPA: hypothetical protein VIG33_16095 [Pseudobdellovibrionaceae bacterium]